MGLIKTVDETQPKRIGADRKDDGNGFGCRLCCKRRWGVQVTITATLRRASSPASDGKRLY
jgi:hypothetical protein